MHTKLNYLPNNLLYFLTCVVVLPCIFAVTTSKPVDAISPKGVVEKATANAPFWILSIGGPGRDYAPSFKEVEDGYVVVGMTSSYGYGDGGGNQNGSHDFMVVKLDFNGNLLWNRVIGGPKDERGSYSVTATIDGGFLLTGTTLSFGAGQVDLFIVKLSATGELEWSKAIGGPGGEGGMTTLEVEDGYVAMGTTDSFGAGKKDLMVVKLRSDGTLEWAKTYGGVEDDVGSGITRVDDGYVIGGTIWSFGAGVKGGEKMYQWTAVGEERRPVEKCTTGAHFNVRVLSSVGGVEDVRRGDIREGPPGLYGGGAEPPGGGA